MRLLLTIFLAFSIPENDCSTFYLIRHAEKVRINKTDRDPALNEKGMIRALNWRDFFIDKDISKIYSTNYKRTLETVKPIAVAMGLTAILYSPSSIDYKNFISSNKGEIVLNGNIKALVKKIDKKKLIINSENLKYQLITNNFFCY